MRFRNILYTVFFLALMGMTGYLFFHSFNSEPAITERQETTGSVLLNKPVAIPFKLQFAGEKVPLRKHFVRERLERELTVNTYWHSSTILLMKRSGRWFPVIEPILAKNGVPEDFKYLALIESGFLLDASPSGASGYWQILKGTAGDLGLEVSRDVDERYHVEKATEAACRYILDAHERFGSWTLVAASYNAGKRRINESLEEQKAGNYYDLFLNDETSRYVYRIIALKQIFENPRDYGFHISEEDLYSPYRYREVEVTEDIDDLPAFAREHGVTYRALKELNPWLRNDKLKVKRGKKYKIAIPEAGF